MPVSVDIVLPCYNPNDSWPDELLSFYKTVVNTCSVRFILVNDGSEGDKIFRQVEYLQKSGISIRTLSYSRNMGKGYALRQGVQSSTSEFIVYTDVDFPFTEQSTRQVIEALIRGQGDIVTGFRSPEYYQNKMSGFRRALSKLFRFFIKDILKMAVSDTQCGLKGFNARGRTLFLATKINRYLFDFEFIYLSGKDQTMRIKPVEVQLKENVVFSKMRLKIIIQEFFNLLYVLAFRRT